MYCNQNQTYILNSYFYRTTNIGYNVNFPCTKCILIENNCFKIQVRAGSIIKKKVAPHNSNPLSGTPS